jgi:hypothetical protein
MVDAIAVADDHRFRGLLRLKVSIGGAGKTLPSQSTKNHPSERRCQLRRNRLIYLELL